jgi:hypothetical protein
MTGLLNQIGALGDRFKHNILPRDDGKGVWYAYDPSKSSHKSPWSWVDLFYGRLTGTTGEIDSFFKWIGLFVIVLIIGPFDLIHVTLRVLIYPFVLIVWWGERKILMRRSMWYFCPSCFNPMHEPLVYCPSCLVPQPQLRPTFRNLFSRKCVNPKCTSRSSWLLLGHSIKTPSPIACRDTSSYKSCQCVHRCSPLIEGYAPQHVIVLGASNASKHSITGHLLNHLHHVGAGKTQYKPVDNLDTLELNLFVSHLANAFQENTDHAEQPGKHYRLANCLLLKSNRKKKLLAFHNVPTDFTKSETAMLGPMPIKDLRPSIMLILNPDNLVSSQQGEYGSHAEIFSRFIRRVQRLLDTTPGEKLQIPLQIVLPFPSSHPLSKYAKPTGELPAKIMQQLISNNDPALNGILALCFDPKKVQYFGGVIGDAVTSNPRSWITPLAERITSV